MLRSCRRCGRMPWTLLRTATARLTTLLAAGVLGASCASADQGSSTVGAATSPAETSGSTTQQRHHRHHRTPAKPIHVAGVPTVDLPDLALTPGAVLTRSAARVCVSGYAASVRDVPESKKEAVYARYGVSHVHYQHEVDHLVSLELGGSNAITNLWPEPYAGRWGARTKDVLENRLHDLVCAGTLTLTYAQRIEARNWVKGYTRYVGAPPPPSSSGSDDGSGGESASGGGSGGGSSGSSGSCEPGYSPCLPIVTDLDCSQIPDSKKPIHVTGSDQYRLDADGNGLGCE